MFKAISLLQLVVVATAVAGPTVVTGRISEFGGPHDRFVKPSEGLALMEKADLKNPLFKNLFLPYQPKGTSGLARRLNPNAKYVAMRWDYTKIPKESLKYKRVMVKANGRWTIARPVDWGPGKPNRVADVSPGVMRALDIGTDSVATLKLLD